MSTKSPLAEAPDQPGRHLVLSVERRFFDALVRGDVDALDDVLAPDFLIVEVMGGSVLSRAEFMSFCGSRQVVFDSIEAFWDDTVIRVHGETAAVVGRTQQRLTLTDGRAVEVSSRYTHLYVLSDDNQWRLTSAQGTQITDRAAAAQ